jgi:hypothetical protein
MASPMVKPLVRSGVQQHLPFPIRNVSLGLLFCLNSLVLSGIEHALYGTFIFTVGLGNYFYYGAVGQ